MDPQTRLELARWAEDNAQYLELERITPCIPRGAQVAGIPLPTYTLTHIPTGTKITVPPGYSRSEIKCREFAEQLLAAAVIALDLNPGTLR